MTFQQEHWLCVLHHALPLGPESRAQTAPEASASRFLFLGRIVGEPVLRLAVAQQVHPHHHHIITTISIIITTTNRLTAYEQVEQLIKEVNQADDAFNQARADAKRSKIGLDFTLSFAWPAFCSVYSESNHTSLL